VPRAIRAILADRMTDGAGELVDRALAAVLVQRQQIERAGWFS
jgi:hypothetical protein